MSRPRSPPPAPIGRRRRPRAEAPPALGHAGEFDRDGAIREIADRAGTSRSRLLRTGALAAGGLAIGAVPVALSVAQGGGLPKSDVDILNFALTLEYLEAAFYAEAVSRGALRGDAARFAQVVAQHEAAHVQALQKTLGDKAVKKPSFDFKGTTSDQGKFIKTAITLEDTGARGRRPATRSPSCSSRSPATAAGCTSGSKAVPIDRPGGCADAT